jgi:hypothetical protein
LPGSSHLDHLRLPGFSDEQKLEWLNEASEEDLIAIGTVEKPCWESLQRPALYWHARSAQ